MQGEFVFIVGMLLNLIASLLIWKIISFFLTIRKEIWKKVLLLFCCSLLCVMIIFIGDPVNLPPTIVIFLTGVLVCCEGSFLSKFTVGCMVSSIALSFNALIDNYFFVQEIPNGPQRAMFWVVVFLLMRRFAPDKDYELSSSLWKLLLFMTLIPIGIVGTLVVVIKDSVLFMGQDKVVENIMLACFFLLLIALISNIGLMWTISILARQTKLEQQQFLEEMNRSYYENMETQQFEIRRLKHDLGNHLQTMLSLEDDKREAYLKGLIQNPVFKAKLQYCADPTVNAVLNNKKKRIEQHKIMLSVKADITEVLPFAQPDVCAMLANLLDNAIEACDKLSESEREITLEMTMQKGLFVLKMSNPILTEGTAVSFQTTKKDTHFHGFGLRSVYEIVKRCGGRLEIEAKDRKCEVLLYLPV